MTKINLEVTDQDWDHLCRVDRRLRPSTQNAVIDRQALGRVVRDYSALTKREIKHRKFNDDVKGVL